MMFRIIIILGIFMLFWLGMIFRLYHISINSSGDYGKQAKANIEKKNWLKPVRGQIYDAKGRLLAMNQIGFSLAIKPHLKVGEEKLETLLSELQLTFKELDKEQILKVYKKKNSPYNHKPIKVVNFIRYRDMLPHYPRLSLLDALTIESETRRFYPYGEYVSHIIGYMGRSNQKENDADETVKVVGKVGKSGIEKSYNTVLQGNLGFEIEKVTARNKRVEMLKVVPPKDNKNLTLNIDVKLQRLVHEKLAEQKAAVAIVMKTTGEVLAAVSYPSFDPNLFSGGISHANWKMLQEDLNRPFINKFLQGLYPPGSTIKMGMALAYDEAKPGILSHSERCTGHIKLGRNDHKFRCWASWGHGHVKLKRAIKESCDVFFYNKSLKVGIDKMSSGLNKLGLGVKTGVDLPREFKGVIPTKAWKKERFKKSWYLGETVIASIGQGYDLTTPLQVARHTAFLASGKLPTPTFAKVVDNNVSTPKTVEINVNKTYLATIRKGMYGVCNEKFGTAFKTMSKLPIRVAGKTGTSQVTSIAQNVKKRAKEEDMEYWKRSHAWITTYAPYKNPKYVVTVLVEHGGHGGSIAGPIAADIYRSMHRLGYFKK